MNNEELLRNATEELLSVIGIPDEYVSEYFDDTMQMLEEHLTHDSDPFEFAEEFVNTFQDKLDGESFSELVDEASSIYLSTYQEYSGDSGEELFEEVRRDYNVKYGGANGPFDEIYKTAIGPGTTSAEKKPKIKGTPHFKKDDAGYGPIPPTGLNRDDYNVKYSKSGALIENKAARKPGIISPALQEALATHKDTRRLVENKIIDLDDLDLLDEDY
jgi:hypothetical protein